MIKTKDFDKTLNKQINALNKFSCIPIKKKGSYFKKAFGEAITDIDINVYFLNEEKTNLANLVTNIYKTLTANPNISFLCMEHGKNRDFLFCDMSHDGKYSFNPYHISNFLNNIENQISLSDFHDVKLRLNKNTLSLSDVMNVNSILKKYYTLTWNETECIQKFKVYNNKKIHMNDCFDEVALMRFVYTDKTTVCLLDVALKHPSEFRDIGVIKKFFSHNQYKVIKALKFYLTYNGIVNIYLPLLRRIEHLVVLEARKMLVELITDYKPILTFQMDCLQREINNFSKDLESQTSLSTEAESIYKKIRTYVDPIHENKISQYEKMYLNSYNQVSIEELKRRADAGIKEPF